MNTKPTKPSVPKLGRECFAVADTISDLAHAGILDEQHAAGREEPRAEAWWGVWCSRAPGSSFWRGTDADPHTPLQTTETEARRLAAALNENQKERTDSAGWRYVAQLHTAPITEPPSPVAGEPKQAYENLRSRLVTIVDEACGLQPVDTSDEDLLTLLEKDHHDWRMRAENAAGESLRLSKLLASANARAEALESQLATAEAQLASERAAHEVTRARCEDYERALASEKRHTAYLASPSEPAPVASTDLCRCSWPAPPLGPHHSVECPLFRAGGASDTSEGRKP